MKDKVKPTKFIQERRNNANCVNLTIIVLVILAAVSISAVYNSNIIGFATNGAINYAEESKRENEILDHTASILESAISNIGSMNGGTSGSTEEPDEDTTPPVEEPEVGIDFGEMTEEDIENNYVGKYVDYTPTSGTFSDHVGATYNGYTETPANTELSTITTLKWKILNVENNILTLISDTTANTNFGLGGADGYNNGVLLLNNACKAMYSNSSLGATGRSLKIEDIESVSSFKGTDDDINYGQEYNPSYKYYPNIFAQEAGGNVGSGYGTLGRSEQSSYVTGISETSTLKGIYTAYQYTMSNSYMKQVYVDLFSISTRNWLASRCVHLNSSSVFFYIFYVSGDTVYVDVLYDSNGHWSNSYAIRPIVEIDLTKVNVGVTGTGAEDDGYSLTLK